jgi:hypothetical protein
MSKRINLIKNNHTISRPRQKLLELRGGRRDTIIICIPIICSKTTKNSKIRGRGVELEAGAVGACSYGIIKEKTPR